MFAFCYVVFYRTTWPILSNTHKASLGENEFYFYQMKSYIIIQEEEN